MLKLPDAASTTRPAGDASDAVQAGENLCTIHYNSEGKLVPATRLLAQSFEIGDRAPAATPLVLKLIGAEKYS